MRHCLPILKLVKVDWLAWRHCRCPLKCEINICIFGQVRRDKSNCLLTKSFIYRSDLCPKYFFHYYADKLIIVYPNKLLTLCFIETKNKVSWRLLLTQGWQETGLPTLMKATSQNVLVWQSFCWGFDLFKLEHIASLCFACIKPLLYTDE